MNSKYKQRIAMIFAGLTLAGISAQAGLQIANGDFQQNVPASGNTNQVVGWFNTLPSGGINSSSWWEGTWYGATVAPSGSPISGSSVMGLGYYFGSSWAYQSIGVNDGGLTGITINFDVGSFADAGSNLRDMGIILNLYQASSFSGAYGTDIDGAAGVTLIDSVSLSTGYLSANQVVPESAILSLATANTTDPLYLRITNYSPDSSAPNTGTAPWAAIDNMTLAPVPEPTTLALAGLGGAALLLLRRNRKI